MAYCPNCHQPDKNFFAPQCHNCNERVPFGEQVAHSTGRFVASAVTAGLCFWLIYEVLVAITG